ncbi:MAG: asparagine synthase (glutamine-hydrolyzing) [Patescibacteria group bacterium]|jgi:asparagine synthase (glutamine-hydrolysing)
MCGITGIYNLDRKRHPENRKIIKKMTETIIHRGPDDEGILVTNDLALGHRRLSILDLSPLGHQPMFYDRGNLVIVFNGEVYNYLEIREELLDKGYQFKSQSDTEVILAAYKEWGARCLDHFNGMWAFVIYDRRRRVLFGARDRLGVKPLYYFHDKNIFIFASEIKALLAHSNIKAKPNDKIVWDYLMQNGLVDHTEETMFAGIKDLRAGHCFTIQNDKIKIEQWWDLDHQKTTRFSNDRDYQEKFRELFFDSIKLRLRSDVPIGSCLSGGLDSSAIVCVVNKYLKDENTKQVGKWQTTFSAVYDSKKYPRYDETPYIREVIRKTHAQSFFVKPSGAKLADEIEKLVWHQDTPFGSTSIYAQWDVFRLAAQHRVKVMLDGQGSDEFMAGYLFYREIFLLQMFKSFQLIDFAKGLMAYDFSANKFAFRDFTNSLLSRGVLGKTLASRYRKHQKEFEIFDPVFQQKYHHNYSLRPTGDVFRNALYTSAKVGLASLLRYEDRNSMAFAIESRVPFLDYRLVEYLYSLPHSQKIRSGKTKWIMREALAGILPEKIKNRPDKIGFETPEKKWIKENLAQEFKKVFASESFRSRGYFNSLKVKQSFEDFLSDKTGDYRFFWRLYNLEIWFRTFIDSSARVKPGDNL